jgi:hypothetical protein
MAIPDSPARPTHATGSPATADGAPSPPTGTTATGAAKVTAETAPYVTRPTRSTIFLRTFVPWQLWRFVRINAKMIRIIRGSRS